jgi:intracellular multiplication protein IcmB
MIELATSFYILGSGTEENAKQLMEKLGFSNAAKISLQNLSKPTAAGASFLGIFKTDRGQCAQIFTNTIGSQTMWAFSSTTEDRNVRNKLYDIIGYKRTLELLARKYPGGVKRILEQRRRSISERGLSEANVNLEQDIIDEILAAAANVD